jgi:hypothetical protein
MAPSHAGDLTGMAKALRRCLNYLFKNAGRGQRTLPFFISALFGKVKNKDSIPEACRIYFIFMVIT